MTDGIAQTALTVDTTVARAGPLLALCVLGAGPTHAGLADGRWTLLGTARMIDEIAAAALTVNALVGGPRTAQALFV